MSERGPSWVSGALQVVYLSTAIYATITSIRLLRGMIRDRGDKDEADRLHAQRLAEALLEFKAARLKQANGSSSSGSSSADGAVAEVAQADLPSAERILRSLSAHERQLLSDLVFPSQISTSFESVGGLLSVRKQLYESLILPFQRPEYFDRLHETNALLSVPKGILFYGPPGTGKTLIAKAIAKSVNCTFINLKASSFQSKWLGESQKLIRAAFSLASKFSPAIIFLDECDSFFRRRAADEHESLASMKGEFLSLWDGLLNSSSPRAQDAVLVLACTNRPHDLDDAFLRRLPRRFAFHLPRAKERAAILRVMLADQQLADDCTLEQLADMTPDYSGSDLNELCKTAAIRSMRRAMRKQTEMSDEARTIMGLSSKPAAAAQPAAASATPSVPVVAPNGSASSAAATSTAADSASSSSASAASSSPSALAAFTSPPAPLPSSPRPLTLSDFRSALKSVRPSVTRDSLLKLRRFEEAQNGLGAAGRGTGTDSEEEESEIETEGESEEESNGNGAPRGRSEESDDDEIYK